LRGRNQHRPPQPEERAGIIGFLAQRPLGNLDPVVGHDLDPLSGRLAASEDLRAVSFLCLRHVGHPFGYGCDRDCASNHLLSTI